MTMSYQVLARKWRPKDFGALVGQPLVVNALTQALKSGRLHHAYLFSGTRGVGKTTIARILSKALNCEKGTSAEPCGQCGICVAIDEGCFPDLIEVDAASNTKVEDTRALLENVPYAPSVGRYKVYLIDEVHMLSTHSFNALLKTLEEPPPHVIFVVATTEPEKIPVTLLSRCIQFPLKPIPLEIICSRLADILTQENQAFELEALRAIAIAASGSMRDALSITERFMGSDCIREEMVNHCLGMVPIEAALSLVHLLAEAKGAALIDKAKSLLGDGVMPVPLCDALLSLFHQIAMCQIIPEYPVDREKAQVHALAQVFSKESVQLFYEMVLMGKTGLLKAPTPEIGMEMLLIRLLAFYPLKVSAESDILNSTPAQVAKNGEVFTKNEAPAVQKAAHSPVKLSNKSLDWPEVIASLKVSGFVKMLADNSICEKWEKDQVHLVVDEQQQVLLNDERKKALQLALSDYIGQTIMLKIRFASVADQTPVHQQQKKKAEAAEKLQKSVHADPFIQSAIEEMGATIEAIHPVSE